MLRTINPGTVSIGFIIWLRGSQCCLKLKAKCCKKKAPPKDYEKEWQGIEVLEPLDPYYASMKNGDRFSAFEEEVVSRERIGL